MSIEKKLGTSTFATGQVWLVEEPQEITNALRNQGSTVINGTRPYVIIKHYGGHITCAPLTTNANKSEYTDHDIVFVKGDITSRIILSQIQTKDIKFFAKYYYTFSPESIEVIMQETKRYFGFVSNDTAEEIKGETMEKKEITNNDNKTVEKSVSTCKVEPKVIPEDEEEKLIYRLKNRKVKTREALFRNKQEAITFLNMYDKLGNAKIVSMLGVTTQCAYNWKHKAKNIAYA